MATNTTTREVEVTRVNGHGFQVAGDEWLNISKYANPADAPVPTPGQRITVHLDKAGFVRKVEPVAPPAAPPNVALAATAPPAAPTAAYVAQTARDIVITRLAVLNTATAILASGSRAASPSDILTLAGQLEVWASR